MHETDRPNPDQGSPEWAVTVDARDLNDLLAVVVAQDPSLRAGSIWQRLNEACSTAGEAEPVHVPALRCLVTQKGQTALDLWLPVGIATDVPIPLYGPITMTLMPIDGTGIGGHGTPDRPAHGIPSPNPDDDLEAALGHVLVSEKVSSDPVHFADLLGKLVDALAPFRLAAKLPVAEPVLMNSDPISNTELVQTDRDSGAWFARCGQPACRWSMAGETARDVADLLMLHHSEEHGPVRTFAPLGSTLPVDELPDPRPMIDAELAGDRAYVALRMVDAIGADRDRIDYRLGGPMEVGFTWLGHGYVLTLAEDE